MRGNWYPFFSFNGMKISDWPECTENTENLRRAADLTEKWFDHIIDYSIFGINDREYMNTLT